MNALAGELFGSTKRSRDTLQIRMTVTHSGLNVASVPRSKRDQAFWLEFLFKVVGALLIPAGGIVMLLPTLLLPGAEHSTLFLAGQFGLLAAFIFVGVALHRWAGKGFRPKVEVDATRSEVRLGTVNADGDFHLRATYPVSQIESFFIIRSANPSGASKLKMRLKTGTQTVSVVEGPEASLIPILERITLTLRPPQMKNRRVRTKTTGRFIRMSFD